jgi:ribonuclease D
MSPTRPAWPNSSTASPFDRIALDTEADSFYHYHEKVCLIQLSFDGRHVLIDPLSGLDVAPLLAILADKVLIIHDAGYDLRILHRQYGFVPRAGIFDTMPAAQLVGVTRFGLADLLEQFLDISVPKKGQKSDWSRRPLEAFQMQYAVADTAWLAALADRLQNRLRELGRTEWHRQSCENVIASAIQHKSEPRKDAWRITGTSRFGPRDLAFVRALWHWAKSSAFGRSAAIQDSRQ